MGEIILLDFLRKIAVMIYQAETENGKKLKGELVYVGLVPYIEEKFEFGKNMVKVVPETIVEVEDD